MADFNCRVFGVVQDDDGRILLIKRSSDYLPGDPNYCGWEVAGGGLEHGETPEEAVIREYEEEVGIRVIPVALYQARTGFRNDRPLLNIGFICRYVGGEVRLTLEHTEYKWVTRPELAETDFGPNGNIDIEKFLSMPQTV